MTKNPAARRKVPKLLHSAQHRSGKYRTIQNLEVDAAFSLGFFGSLAHLRASNAALTTAFEESHYGHIFTAAASVMNLTRVLAKFDTGYDLEFQRELKLREVNGEFDLGVPNGT